MTKFLSQLCGVALEKTHFPLQPVFDKLEELYNSRRIDENCQRIIAGLMHLRRTEWANLMSESTISSPPAVVSTVKNSIKILTQFSSNSFRAMNLYFIHRMDKLCQRKRDHFYLKACPKLKTEMTMFCKFFLLFYRPFTNWILSGKTRPWIMKPSKLFRNLSNSR